MSMMSTVRMVQQAGPPLPQPLDRTVKHAYKGYAKNSVKINPMMHGRHSHTSRLHLKVNPINCAETTFTEPISHTFPCGHHVHV